MRRIADIDAKALGWEQPKALERFYELRADDATVATLSFRSGCGTLAIAESADGGWTFKRIGFLNPRVTIRNCGSDDNLAVYQPTMWGDGVLLFRDGTSFGWKPANFWRTAWAFTDKQDQSVVRLTTGIEHQKLTDVLRTQATLEINRQATADDCLAVLLPFALYLFILQHDDAAAAVAACSAAM